MNETLCERKVIRNSVRVFAIQIHPNPVEVGFGAELIKLSRTDIRNFRYRTKTARESDRNRNEKRSLKDISWEDVGVHFVDSFSRFLTPVCHSHEVLRLASFSILYFLFYYFFVFVLFHLCSFHRIRGSPVSLRGAVCSVRVFSVYLLASARETGPKRGASAVFHGEPADSESPERAATNI